MVVDRDFQRGGGSREGHPFSQVEAVACKDGKVSHIGKQSCEGDQDVFGEFIGLMKVIQTYRCPAQLGHTALLKLVWVTGLG